MHSKKFTLKQSKTSLIIAGILILLNILCLIFFDLNEFTFETRRSSPILVFLSSAFFILYIAFCIFMRIKRLSTLSKGLFIYELVGAFSFAIYFIFFIFNISLQGIPYSIFHAWTIILEPLTVLLARITGISSKFITAMLYLLLTYITGRTIMSIRADITYEKKYQENHNH